MRDPRPIDYFPFEDVSRLRAVGWLEPGEDYTTGSVADADFERLFEGVFQEFGVPESRRNDPTLPERIDA